MEATRHGRAQEKRPTEHGCALVVFALDKAAATVPQREREQVSSRDTCTDEQELALFAVFKRKHLRQIAQEYPFVGSEKTGWIFGSEKFLTQRVCRAVVVGALELHERRGQQIFGATG